MQLRHAALTDVGRARDHNEDTYGIEAPTGRPEGALFLVCDGAGGLAAGETASDLAVKRIITTYYDTPGRDRAAALRVAFTTANDEVFAQGQGKMATTAVAAVFLNDAVLVGNVGDSRALLIRNGQPRSLSRDHSFVAEQVAAGVITPEQARISSYRNIITRALGNRPTVDVDLFREPVAVGDRIVLCSDGLHGLVEAEEIAQAVTLVSLQKAVERLIALANERGGGDNITVVAVEVVALTFAPGEAPDIAPTTRMTDAPQENPSVPPAASLAAGPTSEPQPRSTAAAVVPPPLPPLASSGSGRSFVGWMFVAIALLLLIGTLAYFALHAASTGSRVATPSIPALTPLRAPSATAGATPTLVPTVSPSVTSNP
ncbi:MAG: serine/threonine-protein phosphatase [Herpetosiphonaceae bacterium]|nr:serine/threonine-protein phosphatase [Herpetosiphonaceae bacterium]